MLSYRVTSGEWVGLLRKRTTNRSRPRERACQLSIPTVTADRWVKEGNVLDMKGGRPDGRKGYWITAHLHDDHDRTHPKNDSVWDRSRCTAIVWFDPLKIDSIQAVRCDAVYFKINFIWTEKGQHEQQSRESLGTNNLLNCHLSISSRLRLF